MASKVYECMVLFEPNRFARDPGGMSGKLTGAIEKVGGELLASRLWNEQKLAYPIRGHRKGVYWLTYFRLEGEIVSKLNRELQLIDEIMRHMIVRIDPRLADTMVAMARGEKVEMGESKSDHSTNGSSTEAEAVETATAE